MFSSLAGSALGMLYWILAARIYPTETVGINSAVISASMFLANVAQLNLVNALNRFLPVAGNKSRKLILVSYLLNTSLGILASLVFVFGLSWWAPALGFLADSGTFVLLFALATASWGVFALQDSAMTGMRSAVWVPVENIAYAILKIAFLVVFARLVPQFGILISWFLPLGAAIVVVNVLIFRRMLPVHIRRTEEFHEPIRTRVIAGYVAGDYFGMLFWMAAAFLQPIVITQLAGATANAYFYLSWQIAYALYLVPRMMGMSFVTEVSARPFKLNSYSFKVLTQSARLIIPVVLVILVGAPYILLLFGREYASESAALLRLLSLSAIPQIVVALYLSIARVQRQMLSLVAVQASLSILALILIYSLLPVYGITGIGYAWLISQTAVASFLAVTKLRQLWLFHLDLSLPMQVFNLISRLLWKWRQPRQVANANEMVVGVLRQVSVTHPGNWTVREILRTVSDVTVISIGPEAQQPQALLKIASTDSGISSLRRQSRILSNLRANPWLADLTVLVPNVLVEGEYERKYYLVEELMPGLDGRKILGNAAARRNMLLAASAAIGGMHQRTAAPVQIGGDLLRKLVDDRLDLIRRINAPFTQLVGYDQGIGRLSAELHSSLLGKVVSLGWVHGDYAPGNILVTPDGSQVTGIVDWDLASTEDLPQLDLIHLLLSTRILLERRELGQVIQDLLHGKGWTQEELDLLEGAQSALPGDPLDMRSLVLLSWLRHVSANLTKSQRFASHAIWVTKNVEVVLGSL